MADNLYPGAEPAEQLPEGLDFGNDIEEQDDADDAADAGDATGADDTGSADDNADTGSTDEQGEADADDAGADDTADEESEASDAEAGKQAGKKQPVIPKARLDQALRKQRAAEQRAQELADEIAALRAAQAEAAAPKPISSEEIRAKMAEANEALVAGDTAKAAELQAELMAAIAHKPEAQAPQAPGEVDLAAQVEERIEFKSTLREIQERFPELDENGDSFDQELSEEAVELQQSYMRRGYTLPEATRKAAEAVAKLHDLEDRRAPPAVETNARREAAKTEQAAKSRAKIEKATRAAPPLGGGSDKGDEVTFDIRTASIDEFMALPESVRERLLGNSV
jgi:chemotaxis protein histidine kinase CheA